MSLPYGSPRAGCRISCTHSSAYLRTGDDSRHGIARVLGGYRYRAGARVVCVDRGGVGLDGFDELNFAVGNVLDKPRAIANV